MKKVINLYKPVGLTPLQALNIFKKTNSPYKSKKISYPGRLDPMAEGVLILLVDDEIQSGCFRTGKFLAIENFKSL